MNHRKIGRNEPCVCGSGKKYKACCLRQKTLPPMYTTAGKRKFTAKVLQTPKDPWNSNAPYVPTKESHQVTKEDFVMEAKPKRKATATKAKKRNTAEFTPTSQDYRVTSD